MSSGTSSLLVQIKQDIAKSYPDFENRATKAWTEVLGQLEIVTKNIAAQGPDYLPQVSFSELGKLTPEKTEEIKQKGSVIIRDVVDDKVRGSP
jgi:hypothetical protein